MTGLNASVEAGWYTFTNLGPITSTFTPAPSCTGPDRVGIGYVNPTGDILNVQFLTQATTKFDFDSCTPTTTPPPTESESVMTTIHHPNKQQISEFMAHQVSWRAWGHYYSPGLYCPSGWETIGVVARDGGSSLSSSGIYVPTTASTSTRSYSTDDFYYYMFNYEDKASVLKGILGPKETMAACCPSGMTADSQGLCYTHIETLKPTIGYQVAVGYNYEYGSATTETYIITEDDTTSVRTAHWQPETATVYQTDTYTASFDRAERSMYSAYSYAPMVTMLYHESDLHSASGTAAAAAAASSTSNAAGRIYAQTSGWNGLGCVMGIWAAAAAMGAAMVFPW